MQVSVETLEGLERKVIISFPKEKLEEEVKHKLKDLAKKVKIDGYRPGKVPAQVIERRYSDSARTEAAQSMVQDTLFEALRSNSLEPADYPDVEIVHLEKDLGFTYSATFDVLPVFEIQELNQEPLSLITANVTDEDVDVLLEKLRERNKDWSEVSTAPKQGDKVLIDFEGSVDGEIFEGGSAKDQELVLGSNTMIPGFEAGILGAELNVPFVIQVTFPKDYGHDKLAGKEASFTLTVHKVWTGELPALDDKFAAAYNVTEGGVEAFREDIKKNMVRELDKQVKAQNKEILFDALLTKNSFDVPKTLVEKEIGHLKHEMFHRLFGHEHHENEKIPDFPRELFAEKAKNRVHLGLLFAAYVKQHELSPTMEEVTAMIETMADSFESPEGLREYYLNHKKHLAELQSLVLEQKVADKIATDAKITYEEKDYDAVMNPKAPTQKGD